MQELIEHFSSHPPNLNPVPCSPRQAFELSKDAVFGDLTSDLGFVNAIELTLRLVPLGLLFGGVPCESFGFMAAGTHGRSATSPWGNPFPFCRIGNVCATRFAILVCLCIIRGCTWMLEQPGRTTLHHLPPIQILLHHCFKPRLVRWSGPQYFFSYNCQLHQNNEWSFSVYA